jgi:hypothetical protein
MAKLLVLATLVLLMSCQDNCVPENSQAQEGASQAKACSTDDPDDPQPDSPTDIDDPIYDVPQEALIFGANLQFTNFEVEDEQKVHRAIDVIKEVIASREFRHKVLNHSYNGQKTFVDNKGLSNAEIYDVILGGMEELNPEADHTMELDLELYYSSRNVVGYTYPDTLRIWMNTKYFDPYTPSEVAGNVFHEWLHKLGFEHDYSYNVARDYSVPYALGYMIEELGKQYE